jgi:hypothetical protein
MKFGSTQLHLFGLIPLHKKERGPMVMGMNNWEMWNDGFWLFRSWVKILILARVFTLTLHPYDET